MKFGIESEFRLSNGLRINIPDEDIVDDSGLGRNCIFLIFIASTH
jgi:hypothetical protein